MKGFKIFISYSPSSNSHLRTILKQKSISQNTQNPRNKGFKTKEVKKVSQTMVKGDLKLTLGAD